MKSAVVIATEHRSLENPHGSRRHRPSSRQAPCLLENAAQGTSELFDSGFLGDPHQFD